MGLTYFSPFWGGGGLIEMGGSSGTRGLFDLVKTMVSVLHKEL